ncbi:DnaJ domain-containing protein [Paenibacillus sp. GCM10028914]|uniref:J domain-containing protein n=1 Tax=Paenibacillus sp. GCM10028914 TaxID=3273416 RepID=UPI0036086699
MNYYQILGVEHTAERQEIREAYRRLAKKHHPDVNQNNPEASQMFQKVHEAYRILSDERLRVDYDRTSGVSGGSDDSSTKFTSARTEQGSGMGKAAFDPSNPGGHFETFFGFNPKQGADGMKKRKDTSADGPIDIGKTFESFFGRRKS